MRACVFAFFGAQAYVCVCVCVSECMHARERKREAGALRKLPIVPLSEMIPAKKRELKRES